MTTSKTLTVKYDLDSVDFKVSWLPRRCIISGKSLFLKPSYCHSLSVTPKFGKPVRRKLWMSSSEYLLLQIKGDSG